MEDKLGNFTTFLFFFIAILIIININIARGEAEPKNLPGKGQVEIRQHF